MSYCIHTPCADCTKATQCTDRHVLYGAVCGIHSMPYGISHLGAGSITLDCFNKQAELPPAA